MSKLRFIPGEWGNFHAERYGLIGHDSCDVMTWLDAHPDYHGSIWFDYGAGGEQEIDVTEMFFGADEAIEQSEAA